ncbi:chaperone protein dnaJ 49 [Momordica charantia]|uniref:Chaperone protein dnaJ 49 n=1 Tax=Momordica charantia TaxID=3673 RepID=A0A6J1CMM5_MOMCH|nr:chaperone protein dnaJ 49 [Momordica charantia]
MENSNRAEAERLLGIAEKLLHNRDFTGSKDFAILAQETEPLLDGSDQILAVADVLLASEKRINNHNDWYSILQIERRSEDPDLIKKQYRKLALLLHPDKNKFPYADQAFKLVADSWAVLSDHSKKSLYDDELNLFAKIDLSQQNKLPVRRSQRSGKKQQGFESPDSGNADQSPNQQAVLLPSLPPLVQGQEAYYCCWGFFPMGFAAQNPEKSGKGGDTAPPAAAFPSWMPPIFSNRPQETSRNGETAAAPPPPPPVGVERAAVNAPPVVSARIVSGTGKKRGRPRKHPIAA